MPAMPIFTGVAGILHTPAMFYSIIETAKENGLKPYDCLLFVFETVPIRLTCPSISFLPYSYLALFCSRLQANIYNPICEKRFNGSG